MKSDIKYIIRMAEKAERYFGFPLPFRERTMYKVQCRNQFCNFMRVHYGCTYTDLAKVLERDHATIIHGVKAHENDFTILKSYRANYASFVDYMTSDDPPRKPQITLPESLTERVQELSLKHNKHEVDFITYVIDFYVKNKERRKQHKWTIRELEEGVQMRLKGVKYKDIAAHFGVSQQAAEGMIRKHMAKYNEQIKELVK